MNKTKIEWCEATWNPVTGCLHGCEYCYARRIAERFQRRGDLREAGTGFWLDKDNFEASKGSGVYETKYALTTGQKPEPFKPYNGKITPYPFGFSPTFHKYRLDVPKKWSKPRTIFVCSMADLFGEWVPDEWIEDVFAACEKAPHHRYLFLTKNPERYIALASEGRLPQKDNMWYGTTVTDPDMQFFWADDYNTFLSIEPLLSRFPANDNVPHVKWIIIGAESGNRTGKIVPKKEWVDEICKTAGASVSVFFKDSLIPIVGEENMRRQFPWTSIN